MCFTCAFIRFAPITSWIWWDRVKRILVWLEDWIVDLLWFALYWLQPEEKHCCSQGIFHFQRDILCHMLNFWHESLSFKGELTMKLAVRLPGPEPENWGRNFYMLHCLLYSCICFHACFSQAHIRWYRHTNCIIISEHLSTNFLF